ncbi:MAG: helix-turn-helix domain-containing protein [Lachnospiraceae bacterium]
MNQEKTGMFIAELRKTKGYTQLQLARLLNISDRTVSKWERGAGMPDISMMIPLCEILEISVNELLVGERIPEENIATVSEENIIDILKRYKKKMIRVVVSMTLFSYLAGLLLCFTLSNRLVTNLYMAEGDQLMTRIDEEIRIAGQNGNLDIFKGNVPLYDENSLSYPVCVILADAGGNIIAETATDKQSELYVSCLESTRVKKAGRVNLIEGYISADKIIYATFFECAGETYVVSAYSHINQVLETFRSESFVLSLLIMTGVLIAFWVVLFIMNKMRIGTLKL